MFQLRNFVVLLSFHNTIVRFLILSENSPRKVFNNKAKNRYIIHEQRKWPECSLHYDRGFAELSARFRPKGMDYFGLLARGLQF